MTKKICISGYYGFDNFGDETILKVLTENLQNLGDYKICVFSSNPDKTGSAYNVDSVKSFDLKSVIQKIKECDCLISGGGSLLQDITSKKSLIYYLFIIKLAQLFKKKTIIFAQGIGPINNKILKKLTFNILKNTDYLTVRDEKSLNLLNSQRINANICFDPVWNIIIPKIDKQLNKIGIQLRKFDTLSNDFLYKFAICINKYYSDKIICLLSLQNQIDYEICKSFKDILLNINPNLNIEILENTDNQKVIENIASLNEIIAMRYHACLIAIKCQVKLLPISYDLKVSTLAEQFSLNYLNPYNVNDIEEIIKNFKISNSISTDTLSDYPNTYNNVDISQFNFKFDELIKKI